jgi:hypothetical protein
MPDYKFDTDLTVKPQNQMSLGDVMSAAKSGYELSKLKELYPAMIAKEQALSKTAGYESQKSEIGLQKERQLNTERQTIQGFMSDPKNWQGSDGQIDLDKVNSVLPVIAPLSGAEHATKLTTLANNHTTAEKAKVDMSQQERGIVAGVYSSLGRAGINDPKEYLTALQRLKAQYPDNANIQRYTDAAIGNLGLSNSGPNPNLSKIAVQTAEQLFTPKESYEAFAPKAAVQNIGGAAYQTTTTPSVGGNAPSMNVQLVGSEGGQGGQNVAPKPNANLPKLIQEDESLSYKGSPSGVRNLDDYQKDAYATGNKAFQDANNNIPNVKQLDAGVDRVKQYINSASGSSAYQMVQKGGKWVFGNTDLDSLVKNLAQVQARNASVMGLNGTDSARDLNAKLSGSEKITPEALGHVMDQVKGEATAAKLYTQGLNTFVSKRGDINGKIQQQKFQSAWADAYDPRIFMVDNIASSNAPEKVKQQQIQDITSRMSDEEFAKYKQDRIIIHRLAKGLYQ